MMLTAGLAQAVALKRNTGSPWSPLALTDKLVWFESWRGVLDAGGAACDSGEAVATWTDYSGNGNNLTQPTAGNRPTWVANQLNGLGVVRTTNAGDLWMTLGSAISTVRTAYILLKHATGDSGGNLNFFLGDASTYDWHGQTNYTMLSNIYAAAAIQNGTLRKNGVAVSPVISLQKPTAYSLLAYVTTGNVTVSQISRDRSNGRAWDGDFAALLLCSTAHDAATVSKVETYFQAKTGAW